MDGWTAFFANLPATLIALGTLIGVILNHKRLSKVKEDVHVIEKATNSMKDALIQSTGDKRFLEGRADERRNPEGPSVPSVAAKIREDIAAVPEKTADKVIEKMNE